jgi:SAM-dependent methyltransferase
MLLYIEALGLRKRFSSAIVAHFAPERAITSFIKSLRPEFYIRADLTSLRTVDIQTNIEQIAMRSDSVDILIANHVLEHIKDLDAGLKEFHRILKPGGLAILQTPFSSVLETTFCDPGITSEHARREAYGQEDHVRLFGKDIVSKINACGFQQRTASHSKVLANTDPVLWGVNASEPFFLFEKR